MVASRPFPYSAGSTMTTGASRKARTVKVAITGTRWIQFQIQRGLVQWVIGMRDTERHSARNGVGVDFGSALVFMKSTPCLSLFVVAAIGCGAERKNSDSTNHSRVQPVGGEDAAAESDGSEDATVDSKASLAAACLSDGVPNTAAHVRPSARIARPTRKQGLARVP